MSSTAVIQNSRFTSVSHNFAFQWILNKKELETISQKNASATTIQSDLYELKAFKDLRFYLEIQLTRRAYSVNIKGSKKWLLKLDYAFVVSKENVFTLKELNQLSFVKNFYFATISEEENVNIHCMVTASPVHPDSTTNEEKLILKEGQKLIDFEGTSCNTLPSTYTYEPVIDFILKGTIPNFTIKSAVNILAGMEEHKCELLKILCVKYLMNNITAESLREILKAAVDYRLPHLERECVNKITSGFFQIK
ncbi:hypothetical protein HNY73_014217 [Argiope bruennichi]|uniref:BTB domain-containing protein n=1 Tax=Argiope bruennichi TaxID=94029 RepID=A0A8T0ENK7_ARGBR|nr:hypothetical protein HNY73_014217 [Argiope bruennichi]